MFTAKAAREAASTLSILTKIEKKIRSASKNGEPGVWVENFSWLINSKLIGAGYETSRGAGTDENGVKRVGQTWIWWGN